LRILPGTLAELSHAAKFADQNDMANSSTVTIRIPDELRSAMVAHCETTGQTVSQFLLESACEKLSRPELKATVRPAHRPQKE
jgi:hypothetical protein